MVDYLPVVPSVLMVTIQTIYACQRVPAHLPASLDARPFLPIKKLPELRALVEPGRDQMRGHPGHVPRAPHEEHAKPRSNKVAKEG